MKSLKHTKGLSLKVLINIIALFLVAVWLLPTVGLFLTSLRTPANINTTGWWTLFSKSFGFTLQNYKDVLFSKGIGRAFLNSLIISIPSTIIPILIASLSAFSLVYFKFKGKYLIFAIILALQIIPLQITLIPVLKMYKIFHLSGTFLGVWLAHSAYGLPFAIYLLRNFFSTIPFSVIESARIDGASNLQILTRLIMPLSLPALISLGVFQFLWTWNDLLISLVYLGGSSSVAPLTIKIASMRGSLESGWHIMSTSAFISMIFPLLVFFLLQRYFVSGILAGSIKE